MKKTPKYLEGGYQPSAGKKPLTNGYQPPENSRKPIIPPPPPRTIRSK